MNSGVYEIRNTENGKRYIGSASRIVKRLSRHESQLRRGTHVNPHLQNAWNKYSPCAFDFRPLLFCSESNLLMYEQIAIDGLKPEYNIAKYAGSPMRGRRASLETLEKRALARKGKVYVISPEQRAKISAAHKGKYVSPETRAKLSASLKGRKGNTAFRHKPESIAMMVAAKLGKPQSLEHRAKIRAACVGRRHSAESKAKMSVAQKGKPKSLEARLRMVEAWKTRAPVSVATRLRMSIALKGKPKSKEHNAKVSQALKGRTFSAEHRRNISIARRASAIAKKFAS